ncbi:MAG TPA: phosphate propanoyltransferase [Firmicutes bacterium]|jgi:propanediol utilization protein|nr:phosphate propanoyltransferase [Candidatus Fermentithermobacillaceae bacterium]
MQVDLERLVRDVVQGYFREERQPGAIPVGVSNRHVHLSHSDFATLFGAGEQGTQLKPLKQPGQFALKESVTLIGPKGVIEQVRILGPVRNQTQVEILAGDSYKLGIPIAIRDSGDLQGTPGLVLAGPCGVVELKQGVIVARRHIHASPQDASALGIKDGELVRVAVQGQRSLVFGDVMVRVHPEYCLELHVDVEEANAAQLKNEDMVTLA